MAKIEACNSFDLSIHLDSFNAFFPGQRITGFVSRISRWVGTETSISISLHGRCNTEFFCRDSLCLSSLELFGKDGFRKELFNGALHIQTSRPDEKKWFFAIDIPRHPDPSFLRSHPFGKASYLSLLSADQHVIPPSFDLGNSSTNSCGDFAVVEYYLEAIMMTPSSKPVIARMPVQVRCESPPFPITDFDIKLHSRQPYTIVSPYLIPGIATANPLASMGQKIARVLGFSRAPRLPFRLEISIASVLQKGSPYHIPLELRAIPQWMDTSEYVMNVPQIIDINEFTLSVRSTSSLIAIATDAVGAVTLVREDHLMTKIILADYMKPKMTNQMKNQELQSEPCSFGESFSSYPSPLTLPIGDNTTPLDIGQMLDLKLRHEQFPVHEVPTFITHNIKRTHELEWKMSLKIGGQIFRVKGKHPVLIMEKTG
ncbi:hypothetical protein N7501_000007 [Penicillium viridicatum]|nr:hypothetical protein N7501_012236 [Penicillium viridicatum]KAJ5976665.1 hypothetical protein N7501_000007 [Penicillium viridicatum]